MKINKKYKVKTLNYYIHVATRFHCMLVYASDEARLFYLGKVISVYF
jgi:hypothetical protein